MPMIVVSTCTNDDIPTLNEKSNVKASSKALDTAIVSNGAALMNGFNHMVVDSSVLPLVDVVEPNTEFLSSSISNEGAAIDLCSVAVTDASKNVDVVHYSEAKELPSSDTNVMATPAKVFSIITTSASGVHSSTNSFRKASSSNKYAVLDLASDVVLPDDSEEDVSSGSDDSDEDLILNLKSPFSEKHLQDRPLQLPIRAINNGRGGRRGERRGRGNRGRRGGFG
ncbi:unnamed protein product [Arabidopsis lyrata]|nr:unnamed protein product [Arabidopsis lyrata]